MTDLVKLAKEKANEMINDVLWDSSHGHDLATHGNCIEKALLEYGAACLGAGKIPDEEYRNRLCMDPAHDIRYCATCSAMQDGIEFLERRIDALKSHLEEQGKEK